MRPTNWASTVTRTWKCFIKRQHNSNYRGAKSECDGLFIRRGGLWLGASAGAVPLRGSGCRNLALRAFMNKPPSF